jgi:solute:Na+ symporter, SSS family
LNYISPYDYLVILAYLVALIWIGKYFSHFNKDMEDFFRGGSKLPWWVGGISAFMAGFSAWMFTGGAGVVYENGPVGILALCTGLLGTFVGYLVFAKRWRRARVTSLFEYVSSRFNMMSQQMMSWFFLPMNLFYCSTVLLATSIFFTAATGLEGINLQQLGLPWDVYLGAVQLTILIAGGVILTYCYFGGLIAVATCDVLSFLIIIPLAVLIVPLILIKLNGTVSLGQIFTTPANFVVPEGKGILSEPITIAFVMMWLISNIHSYNTNPIVQRYFSVPDEKAARKVALFCTILFLFGISVWALPPLAVRHLYPDLSLVWTSLKAPAEGAYVSACLSVLPHGLIGVMFAAIFAASMSSIDSTLNFISGIFANDIYAKVFKPGASDAHMLRVSRLSTLGLGVLAIALALAMSSRGGAFKFMIVMDRIFVTPIVVPLLMGLFFPRKGSRAAMFTFLGVLPFNIFAFAFLDLSYSTFMLSSFLLAYVIYFLSAFLGSDTPEKKREIGDFFRKLETPVEADLELKETAIDKLQMLSFVGRMACVTGLSISSLTFIPQPFGERGKVLLGGVTVLVVGLTMLYFNWRARKQTLVREAQLTDN